MQKTFTLLCEEQEEFSKENVLALENALQSFVQTDVTLALEILFVDEDEIRRLNSEMRAIDKVTDVLSFPTLDGIRGEEIKGKDYPYDIDEDGNLMLGSIVVCCKRAREQAEEYGHSYERELHYLIVHGVMHCLGYDHITDEDKAQMRQKEEYVLGKLGIAR
jgi:probable rRNA maturation factor